MRKLLMSLFLLGTLSMFCNAQIEGYYVRQGETMRINLFADEVPRPVTEIGIEAGKYVTVYFTNPETGSFYWDKIDSTDGHLIFTPDISGSPARIVTSTGSKGKKTTFRITSQSGKHELLLTIYVY